MKYGIGANVEYALRHGVRLFARSGWNSGDTESFAYTEVNSTAAVGSDVTGAQWRRPGDRVGLAFVSNGLSTSHAEDPRLGGLGFLLGDGRLRYGRETMLESYYTAHLWRGVFGSVGAQFIANPGYNRVSSWALGSPSSRWRASIWSFERASAALKPSPSSSRIQKNSTFSLLTVICRSGVSTTEIRRGSERRGTLTQSKALVDKGRSI